MTNQEKYLQLLAEFGVTQAESATLIAEQTQRPCSVRTVRSWLNDPTKASSRPCPNWAIEVLEKSLNKMKKKLA